MKYFIFSLAFILIIICCDPCRKDHSCDGDIKVSEIINKKNYTFPIVIEKDVAGEVYFNGLLAEFHDNLYILPHAGFYEMVVKDKSNFDTVLFNLLDPERGEAEWGLKKWIPEKPQPEDVNNEPVISYYPKNITSNIPIPFVFYLFEGSDSKLKNTIAYYGENRDFNIKNGVGSVEIITEESETIEFIIGNKEVIASINSISEPYMKLSGTIQELVEIPPNVLVHVTDDLEITKEGGLVINEGVVFIISPQVNIMNEGPVTFQGVQTNPILVTCSEKDKYWGGFISEGANSKIECNYSFFTRSGFHTDGDFNLGHAKRQALFQTNNSELVLSNCYLLDHVGQIFYPIASVLKLDNILVQRAKSGGQFNVSEVEISNSVFTDFPDDSQVYQDEDNDCLYVAGSNLYVQNSIFMYAKDDGIDSGGGAGGEVIFERCIFEACFHEGAALSSIEPAVKNHIFKNCTFKNNGQGVELGYSSSNHSVLIDSCWLENNHIGIRYGDCYENDVLGNMLITNTVSINNDRDVWNMVRSDWKPNLGAMNFENTYISKVSAQYPELKIYN